jgi:hypothetical protein
VAVRLGALRWPWQRSEPGKDDPYWDHFINAPPADSANSIVETIRRAPEGNVFPTKADIHTPEITSSHVKDLARYLGADLVGIARLNSSDAGNGDGLPFAVVCAVRADYDPRNAPGIGGQVPVQNGLFITFVLSAWIRELGFRATIVSELGRENLAAEAGLGKLDPAGRLVTRSHGSNVYVADIICTDLPVAPAG